MSYRLMVKSLALSVSAYKKHFLSTGQFGFNVLAKLYRDIM